MDGIGTFFEMGGYGVYVWPAFAVTAIVLIGLALVSLRTLRDNEETLNGLQGERRRRAPVSGDPPDGADGDGR
jgi:heme exporter protein D